MNDTDQECLQNTPQLYALVFVNGATVTVCNGSRPDGHLRLLFGKDAVTRLHAAL